MFLFSVCVRHGQCHHTFSIISDQQEALPSPESDQGTERKPQKGVERVHIPKSLSNEKIHFTNTNFLIKGNSFKELD